MQHCRRTAVALAASAGEVQCTNQQKHDQDCSKGCGKERISTSINITQHENIVKKNRCRRLVVRMHIMSAMGNTYATHFLKQWDW